MARSKYFVRVSDDTRNKLIELKKDLDAPSIDSVIRSVLGVKKKRI